MENFKSGIYRHFKGNLYEALFLATDSENLQPIVVYKALYGDGGIWVRPFSMWNEEVTLPNGDRVKRFTYVGENQ